jgi:hypothetical protein
VSIPPRRSLSAADGAKFRALIEEMPDGQWRASGQVKLDMKSKIEDQTSDIEMFPSEEQARAWAETAARARGFSDFFLKVVRQPGSAT